MALQLSDDQVSHLLTRFEASDDVCSTAHTSVWKRRAYAPMYIHDDELRSFRDEVARRYPDYVIAFDVIFDSNGGRVDHHVDHESLGPFHVNDRWRALRDHHFLSIHVNLTPNGGSLATVEDYNILSYIFFVIIAYMGIFTVWHRMLLWCTMSFLSRVEQVRPNQVGLGNVFDNTHVHSVTAGAARTSYVLRLVRPGVTLTQDSVRQGISRSDACQAFTPLLNVVVDKESVDAGDVNWQDIFLRDPKSAG